MIFAIRNWLPNDLKNSLWENRKRWGFQNNVDDSCWQEWLKHPCDLYRRQAGQSTRWSGRTRNWEPVGAVWLNPEKALEAA